MNDPIDDATVIRCAGAAELARALTDGRARTLRLFEAMRGALGPALDIPYAEEVNPPLWELGHVGWFEEFWIARNTARLRGAAAPLEATRAAPLLRGADALYNSSTVAHTSRWRLDLPDAQRTLANLARGRERTLALLGANGESDDALYFFRLALCHEAMHHEAGTMIAQGLGLDVTPALAAAAPAAAAASGELAIEGARMQVGRHEGGFAFDNELGAHEVEVACFRIDRAPVTWSAYLPFVDAGGYDDPKWWSREGWRWRGKALPAGLPRYVRRHEDGSLQRVAFGRPQALDAQQPALNLSQHEASAWCAWAGRRLPTEHEWTLAQAQGGADFDWGQMWEWTASAFEPWPGFVPHPYRDYSQPWFDGRPVLKGASFATAPHMKHPRYRNFFTAGRNDVFAGFRSCAA